MRKIVTTILELDVVESEWLKRLMIETYSVYGDDEDLDIRQKIVTSCTYVAPISISRPSPLNEITLNEKEVEWLKGLVQNPRCHPDDEKLINKKLRYRFWTTLSDEIVRAAHAATPADDDIPF